MKPEDDLYRWMASRRLGIPYAEVTDEQRAEMKTLAYASLYNALPPRNPPTPLWLIIAAFTAPATFIIFMFAAMVRWWLET